MLTKISSCFLLVYDAGQNKKYVFVAFIMFTPVKTKVQIFIYLAFKTTTTSQ
jgi:hypothetical protein